MKHSVDLIVNIYERTYRKVLVPGFFPSIEAQNQRRFANRIAVINNVVSREDAKALAEVLRALGEIDSYFFVSDHIDQALAQTGLIHSDLGRVGNFINWALVAVTLAKSPWFVNWDCEIWMETPINWIDPSIEFMSVHNSVFVSSPNPNAEWIRSGVRKKAMQLSGNFALGYGFSDQVFLGRTAQFTRPIYKDACLSSLRYPLSHLGAIFEQRVDAHMRNHKLKRAIYVPASYRHPKETEGLGYPMGLSRIEKLKMMRNRYIHRKLRSRNIVKLLRWIGMEHLTVF